MRVTEQIHTTNFFSAVRREVQHHSQVAERFREESERVWAGVHSGRKRGPIEEMPGEHSLFLAICTIADLQMNSQFIVLLEMVIMYSNRSNIRKHEINLALCLVGRCYRR